MNDDIFTCNAFYSGRVQGVGFRFKTYQIASGYSVTGFVRNLDDGRVEIFAQGDENEVKEFVTEVKRLLSPFIKNVQDSYEKQSRKYKTFDIK